MANTKKTAAEGNASAEKKTYDYASGKDYVYNFIKTIIDKHGPRLPGSAEEQAASHDIEKYLGEATGKPVVRESFKLAPVASIGAISLLGIYGFVMLVLYYVNPIISMVLTAIGFAYAIIQIFMYKGWFDKLWKQHDSQNLYSVIDGGEKIDYTIVYSGHMDSSWNWNHSDTTPQFFIPKTALFILSFLAILVFSIINVAKGNGSTFFNIGVDKDQLWMTFLPLITIPGLYFGATFLSWDKRVASPGAMDNLSGVGTAMFMGKYYKENPEKLPKNCRIICAALGSEEAGLKGSIAFMKAHKDDKDLLINPIFLNVDSVSDYDHFGVISGDLWQGTNFDKGLIDLSTEVFKSLDLKTQAFKNPIGGCDSTPFCKAGYRTVTLVAQNPVLSNYYHTMHDKYERLDQRTMEKMLEGLVLITEKLHEEYATKA
jgi:hypothetical protein